MLVPSLPVLPVLVPVEQAVVLLAPALAACALVSWWHGGRPLLALAWTGLAVWLLTRPLPGSADYAMLARGWGVLLAGVFGLICLLRPGRPFLEQALPTVAISLLVGIGVLATGAGGSGPQLARLMTAEFAQRTNEWLLWLQRLAASPEWAAYARRYPDVVALRDQVVAQYAAMPGHSVAVLPAMLALESLAVLALAWALYQRLGRARVGPPLGALRSFRFSDQLIWGLIVGITFLVVPGFGDLRGIGVNLLVFFGALYVVRGLGVLAWLFAPRRWARVLLVAVGVLAWQLLAPFALAIGIGDTWLDWRNRARPTS
ncbi:MAG TPA: DUF2232 domain-containing protein [Gemmatimonadaceae bacterium]|nr:DUF2232 domain-containing protein [Gemmatimonadaceae bacterium]